MPGVISHKMQVTGDFYTKIIDHIVEKISLRFTWYNDIFINTLSMSKLIGFVIVSFE